MIDSERRASSNGVQYGLVASIHAFLKCLLLADLVGGARRMTVAYVIAKPRQVAT